MAARMATAAMIVGPGGRKCFRVRVPCRLPFERARTITAFILNFLKDLSLLQQMLHPRQGFRFAAERFESLAFEIEKILFGRRGLARRHRRRR